MRLRMRARWVELALVVTSCAALLALNVTFGRAAAGPTLSGSNFESGDGDLIAANHGGLTDWSTASTTAGAAALSFVSKTDTPSGGGDDAFGQGSKEDSPCPTDVDGSIPPNKSDLSRFYSAHEKGTNGHDFLYLAWERTNVLGNANMDFEFNQSSTKCATAPTPVRTVGDMLITFDFENGGSSPVLGLKRWTGSAWGTATDLSAAGAANGAVNTATVSDPLAGVSLPGFTFGEAGIDLTLANVFPAGQCVSFGSAFLKSRSSSSFTAEMKDFIAPAAVTITNCGSVRIHKQSDTGAALSGVGFTLYNDNPPVGVVRGAEDTITTKTCSTNGSGDCTITNVPFGNYWVVETSPPAGFTPAPDQAIALTPAVPNPPTFTFIDTREPASVTLHKQDDAGNPVSGAVFTLFNDLAPVGGTRGAEDTSTGLTCTTGATGNCTINGALPPAPNSPYWVAETTVPAGYDGAADRHITLSLGDTLNISSTPFVDVRRFTIIVLVCREGSNQLTSQSVTVDGVTKSSLVHNGGGALSDASLCGLPAGANYTGKHVGAHSGNVNIN